MLYHQKMNIRVYNRIVLQNKTKNEWIFDPKLFMTYFFFYSNVNEWKIFVMELIERELLVVLNIFTATELFTNVEENITAPVDVISYWDWLFYFKKYTLYYIIGAVFSINLPYHRYLLLSYFQ